MTTSALPADTRRKNERMIRMIRETKSAGLMDSPALCLPYGISVQQGSVGVSARLIIETEEGQGALDREIPEAPLVLVTGKREPLGRQAGLLAMRAECLEVFIKEVVLAAGEHEAGKLRELFISAGDERVEDRPGVFFRGDIRVQPAGVLNDRGKARSRSRNGRPVP